ncbi:MAG: hypothetical protein WA715_22000 [Candidatus Acidiferrum sp.]
MDLYNALAKEDRRGGDRKSHLYESKSDNQKAPGSLLIRETPEITNAIAKVSQAAGVHPATTKRMLNIEQHGSPKLKAQVMAGEVGIQTALLDAD